MCESIGTKHAKYRRSVTGDKNFITD